MFSSFSGGGAVDGCEESSAWDGRGRREATLFVSSLPPMYAHIGSPVAIIL